jgi:hypothetical protein
LEVDICELLIQRKGLTTYFSSNIKTMWELDWACLMDNFVIVL